MVTLLWRKGNSYQLSMKGQHLTSGLMHSKNLHCVTKIVKSPNLIIFVFFILEGLNILPIWLMWSSSILREYMNNISNLTSHSPATTTPKLTPTTHISAKCLTALLIPTIWQRWNWFFYKMREYPTIHLKGSWEFQWSREHFESVKMKRKLQTHICQKYCSPSLGKAKYPPHFLKDEQCD